MLAIYDGVFCGCSSFGMGVGMMFRFEWIFKGKNDFWLIFVVENDFRSSFCKHTVASKKIKYRICIPKSRNEFSRIVCFAILRIRNLLEINRIPFFPTDQTIRAFFILIFIKDYYWLSKKITLLYGEKINNKNFGRRKTESFPIFYYIKKYIKK